jgi:hypothetical protein
MPTKGYPAGGPKHAPKTDPIEARLIEIRNALKQITKVLIEANRQTRNSQRAA